LENKVLDNSLIFRWEPADWLSSEKSEEL